MRALGLKLLGLALPVALAGRRVYRQIIRPITIGVRAIVLLDGQLLLVRHHGATDWLLPGGLAGRAETLRDAALREVHEESGCSVMDERLLGIYSSVHEGMTLHTAVFVCHATSSPRRALNIEIADARFWPLDALPPTHGDVEQRLAEYVAGAQGVYSGGEAPHGGFLAGRLPHK